MMTKGLSLFFNLSSALAGLVMVVATIMVTFGLATRHLTPGDIPPYLVAAITYGFIVLVIGGVLSSGLDAVLEIAQGILWSRTRWTFMGWLSFVTALTGSWILPRFQTNVSAATLLGLWLVASGAGCVFFLIGMTKPRDSATP